MFQQEILAGPLASLACALLEVDEVILFQDNVIEKPPSHSVEVQWHQDYAYWPLDRPEGITLWVALSEVSEASGCLQYLPGTHLWGERQPTDFMPETHQPKRTDLQTIRIESHHRPVACPLRPGEVLAHHPLTWHMSAGNQTARARCGWSLTFVSPSARWKPSHAPHPLNYSLNPTPSSPLAHDFFPRLARTEH
jgi:ectoine hydroxylase-related dioxygenase (phytanoyl-CoA dioxygenase family)